MSPRKVLLIGWDAADWKVIRPLMDAGRMRNVRRLVENGASGQIRTLHPPLSPMLWTSIATGKRPFKHGIHGFSEPTPDGCGVRPVTNLSRKSKAIWNILNQSGLRSIVIGWWPSHPAEPINGVMVSDHYHRASGPLERGWPLLPHTVHPPELAATLTNLRMHPDQIAPELVEQFIPLAREIDQDSDKRLAGCMRTLAECISIHSAATWLIDHREWDFFAVYYDAIDHFCHGFMKYHPPRQPWISERDFELYNNVVTRAYEFHDQMLGTLLQKADNDTVVMLMSDHGFHPDHLRPSVIPDIPAGPAVEHRDFGIVAISGPGIRKRELLLGASVLDIAPTILSIYGLAVGEDMDGRVLSQAFAAPPQVRTIPSWEEVPGEDGTHPPHARLDPVAANEAIEQMIALGYIERPDENREIAVRNTIRELQCNLGESYQDDDRHPEALEIFRELSRADPDEQRYAVRLFISCQALGMIGEMRRIVDDLDGRRRALFEKAVARLAEGAPAGDAESDLTGEERSELKRCRNLARYHPAVTDYLKAQLLTAEKRYSEALAELEKVAQAEGLRPALVLQTAELSMRLRRFRDAEQMYRKALEADPDDAHAHMGLCRLGLRRRQFTKAAQCALDALDRANHDPTAHYLLGLALAGMTEYERAAEAFRHAISLNPNFPEAHLRLAKLLEAHMDDAGAAREHRRLARQMKSRTIRRSPVSLPERDQNDFDARTPLSSSVPQGMPLLSECLVIVTGLPRSGTSMVMQMLSAGGMPILTDRERKADEDNPRGYFEFEPVKQLLTDAAWLTKDGPGKAVKIVAPLLSAVPAELPCRVILLERDLDEVLDSQEQMLARGGKPELATSTRRGLLKDEYRRTMDRVRIMTLRRPRTSLLVLAFSEAIASPEISAAKLNDFLGGGLNIAAMAAAVDPFLHRHRA